MALPVSPAGRSLALLRIVAGLMFACHGAQKLFGWPVASEHGSPALYSQQWVGGVLELGLGALIFLGLFTRVAAFLASGEMAVAYLQFHWKLFAFDGTFQWLGPKFDATFWPIVNHGELAALYCFVFLFFVFAGPGRCALDNLLFRRRTYVTTSTYAPPPTPRTPVPPPSPAYPRR